MHSSIPSAAISPALSKLPSEIPAEVARKIFYPLSFSFCLINEYVVPIVLMEVVQTMVTSTSTRATEIISFIIEVGAYQVSLALIIVDANCRLKHHQRGRMGASRA